MTILLESVAKNVFVFRAKSVSDIILRICEYIDQNILEPEDLELFIQYCFENLPPSVFAEINIVLNKRVA